MADIKKIKVGNTTYDIRDATAARSAHSHSAGVGLVGSGSAGTDGGTYDYKAKLRSETALTVDSAAATTTSGRVYPVAVDKSGYLSVNVPWTDTKNTAGSTDDTGTLYLVGAKTQDDNPQTYSNSKVYMTDGTLTANNLSTNTLVSQRLSSQLNLKVSDSSDALHDVASFGYYNPGGAHIDVQGYLTLNEAGGHPNKPENKTGLPSVSYADYFNTGITAYGISASSGLPVVYKLSFPGKSGTLSTIKYKHNIALSGLFSGGPGGSVYCTFSFINDSSATISNLSDLNTALAANFSSKICPACGLFGYNSSGAELKLVTGVTYDYGGTCIYYMSIASTTSTGTMTINDVSSAEATIHPYSIFSAAIADTVEEC